MRIHLSVIIKMIEKVLAIPNPFCKKTTIYTIAALTEYLNPEI